MPQFPDAVWVNVNPSFRQFDQPLINKLAKNIAIAEWKYCQTLDEPNCLDVAVVLLQDYLKHCDHPVHLIGHGTGGLISLLYSNFHPERVKSLTLLSVGAYPAIDWQAHYYAKLNLLTCSREMLLTQMVYSLFGDKSTSMTQKYLQALDEDLSIALSVHNLYQQQIYLMPGQVSVPLLVCRGERDRIIDRNLWQGWESWMNRGDRLWECPKGLYFFHYSYPKKVSQQIQDFWQTLSCSSSASACQTSI